MTSSPSPKGATRHDGSGPSTPPEPSESLEALRRFTLETLDRILSLHPGEFAYQEHGELPDGQEAVVFAQHPAGRRVAMRFGSGDGLVQLYQLTTAGGGELRPERRVRDIDPASSSARSEVTDAVCWVLVGGRNDL